MSTVVFACVKLASYMNLRAASAPSTAAAGWHSLRYLLGLICAAIVSLPWLYLLVEARVPLTVAACTLVGAVVSTYLFIKHRVFGQVTVVRG